jgi:PAN domain
MLATIPIEQPATRGKVYDESANDVVPIRCAFVGGRHSRRRLRSQGNQNFQRLVGLFFIVIGFWQPGALTGVMPAAATMSEREHDKDRFGGDYSGFDVTTDHIELCEDTCKTDSKCFAWTYVKPGIQASQARCYLKSVVPAISNNACCVSGTKIR